MVRLSQSPQFTGVGGAAQLWTWVSVGEDQQVESRELFARTGSLPRKLGGRIKTVCQVGLEGKGRGRSTQGSSPSGSCQALAGVL